MTPEQAHKFSNNNRDAIEANAVCGCFYCCRLFSNKDAPIEEWIDGGETALCPFCGIDSVLSVASVPHIISSGFLKSMHDYWFSYEGREFPAPSGAAAHDEAD